ncbi:CGLAU_01105 family protein [Corynebacterium lubricantis]|uniref:CGLAU_01105 family protein n=1 Tax=Corynebacterium lubricantis TaxID=541095 RepID=UPI0003784B71|nr:CGLAU_01105 family protein [Corynebacterium lubricantis]
MTEPNNSLKGIGEALVNAGGRLGDVVGDFTDRFKADSPEGNGLGDQVKQAVARARTSFSEASDADQYKRASASFAGDAESIFRDLAGSVSRAAQGTKDSAELGAARESLNSAMDQIRQAFDQSVGQIRERTEKSGTDQDKKESEGFINDMRGRLEGMISRVNEGLDNAKDSTKDSANTDAPDIIDGEVVTESDSESDTDTKNPPTGENS